MMNKQLINFGSKNRRNLYFKAQLNRWCFMAMMAFSHFTFSTLSAQIVINEVNSAGTIELLNSGSTTVDVSGYWFCDFPAYTQLSNLTLDCGSLNMAPGQITAISGFTAIAGNDAELGLYSTNSFGSSAAMVDYIEWGFSGHQRSSVAVAVGVWTSGEFIPTFSSNESISFDGNGNTAADYTAGPSSFCSPNGATGLVVDGGTLTGGPFTFCVDGVADNIPNGAITLAGNAGPNNQLVVTDNVGNILGLPPTFSAPDFDAAGEGVCFFYNVAYEDGLTGLETGLSINSLNGNFSLSNPVTIYRNAPDGGAVTLVGGGTSFAMCAGVIVFDVEYTTTAGFLSYWYIITDETNNILDFANSANTNTLDLSAAPPGTCRVWGWSYRKLSYILLGAIPYFVGTASSTVWDGRASETQYLTSLASPCIPCRYHRLSLTRAACRAPSLRDSAINIIILI